MLKSIRLQNFFGFQDCTINLEKGANVLVGINGSGKSNFFKAIRFITQLPKDNELKEVLYKEFGGLQNVLFADSKRGFFKTTRVDITCDILRNPEIETNYSIQLADLNGIGHFIENEYFEQKSKTANRNLEEIDRTSSSLSVKRLNGGVLESMGQYQVKENTSFLEGSWENNYNGYHLTSYNLFRNYLDYIKTYNIFDTSINSPLRKPNAPSLQKTLSSDASNLASLINDIKLSDKETYNNIINALKNVNENFIGVEFKQLSGFIEMWLEEKELNKAISPIHVSDGTLKFLCLMTILYNRNRGEVICLDEPESGLHPDMINTLYEAIEFAAETSQVIISTHSAHLLNYFEVEQVRVFEKDENNATIVNQYTKELYENWNQKFQLGKAWREGVIGGKRW